MFGDKLKALRKKRYLTQAQLAKELNVSSSTIAMYENNSRKPSYEMAKKVANYFSVTVDYLINEPGFEECKNLDFLIENIKKLSPSERQYVEDLIEFMNSKYHK